MLHSNEEVRAFMQQRDAHAESSSADEPPALGMETTTALATVAMTAQSTAKTTALATVGTAARSTATKKALAVEEAAAPAEASAAPTSGVFTADKLVSSRFRGGRKEFRVRW